MIIILIHALKKYAKESISLHVPGHHNGTIGQFNLSMEYDMTEITGLDDYHHAEGVIKQSEASLSRSEDYQSKFLVSGTTVGILSVIYAYHSKYPNKKIAIMRNAHQSVFHGLSLCQTEAYILPTSVSNFTKQYNDINLESVDKNALDDIGLVILTYPNYYGETYPIDKVIKYFHKRGIEVLVDEAHGAHFDITNNFPKSSLNFDADYVVMSYHKTLPSLTMSSVIHMRKTSTLNSNIFRYLNMLQSSSPSYLLMASLESAHNFYKNYNDNIFFKKRKLLINQLKKNLNVIETNDPLKILVTHDNIHGALLQSEIEKLKIYTELCTEQHVLLVLPLWHENDSYPFDELLSRFSQLRIDISVFYKKQLMVYNEGDGYFVPPTGVPENVHIDDAVGCSVYESLIPYPPGIPYVLAGETLTEAHITTLRSYTGVIHGMMGNEIKIIK